MMQRVRKADVQPDTLADKKPKDVSGKSIQARLENWGRCQRGAAGGGMSAKETRSTSPHGGQGYTCMTAVVCNIMASAAAGQAGWRNSVRSNLDFADSDVINQAWMQMPARQKTLIKLVYALNMPQAVVCRQLEIRHWPTSHFRAALSSAENIIGRIVDISQNKSIISINSIPSGKTSDAQMGGITDSRGNESIPLP